MPTQSNNARKWVLTGCITLAIIAGSLYWLKRKADEQQQQLKTTAAPVIDESGDNTTAEANKEVLKLSKNDVLAIMDRVIDTQHSLRALMNDVVEKIRSNELAGIKSIYEYIQKTQPDDPLEAHGLTMAQFDQLMAQWQDDPDVTRRTYTIVNGPTYESDRPEDLAMANTFSIEKLIEIHEGILERLVSAHSEVKSLEKSIEAGMFDSGSSIEKRSVAILLQALVAEYTLTQHNVSAEALEIRVMQSQNLLANRADYLALHQKIQDIMDYAAST